jgi:LPS-assembly lipoprotein
MRILILLLLPLFLSSCYQPVYGERPFGAPATAQETRLNRIAIANIPDEQGQILRNYLIDRMYGAGRPDKTDATLNIAITKTEEDLGLQKDATTLRKKINYIANYSLVDNATHKNLYTRTSRTFVSYDKIDTQYGVVISKEASADRAYRELSDLIVTQLLIYYGQDDHSSTPLTEAEQGPIDTKPAPVLITPVFKTPALTTP